MKIHQRGIWAVVLILLVGLIYRNIGKQEEVEEVKNKQPLSVSIAIASKTQKFTGFWLTGTIEGLTSAIISSRYSEPVEMVYVENGQRVRRCDKLFSIDSKELENNVHLAESDVKKAKVNHENLTVSYQRKQHLFNIGAVSKEILESADVQWRTSLAELDDVETKLQIAIKRLEDATVTSPVNGVVANKKVTMGQVVSAGTQLMTVEEIDSVYVTVQVEQQYISKVSIGTKAHIKVDSVPDRVFNGEVAVINPVAGKENRLFEVKIRVDNPDYILMPGMFAEVLMEEEEKNFVLAIPRSALVSRKGQNYVYVITDEGQAQRKRIEVGELMDDNIEILSGLNEGENVIIDNTDKLKDGDFVKTHRGDDT